MAGFMSLVFAGAIAVALLKLSAAHTEHVVGGEMGWKVPPSGSEFYKTWADDKTFVVGDILSQHDVQEVTKESYDGCTPSDTIASPINISPANITLRSTGDKYYICTFGSHCLNGQKLAIKAVSATAGGSPPPSSSPTPPSPSGTSAASASVLVSMLAVVMGFLF